jgi:hypothetical protein
MNVSCIGSKAGMGESIATDEAGARDTEGDCNEVGSGGNDRLMAPSPFF